MLHYLWRAVDQRGVVLDILVQGSRNGKAAKRFFKRLLHVCSISLAASSPTDCAAMASLTERYCLGFGTGQAGISTSG